MSEKVIPFPNKINNPSLFKGYHIDTIITGVVIAVGSFLFFTFYAGGVHTALGVVFSEAIGLPMYCYAKKKMNRGYVSHWFWSRGRKRFECKKKDRDNLPIDFLPKGFDTDFRD